MSGRDTFQPNPETRFASKAGRHAAAAQYSLGKNRLLALLPAEDYERLWPALELIPLPRAWPVRRASEQGKYLYFPTAGIVSTSYVAANGASTEISITGNEGAIGIASILGGESMPTQAVVLSAGYAYRLGAEQLKSELKRHYSLLQVLLRYIQALIVQTGQAAVCNRHHSVEQQLCRCILSWLDRLPSNDLLMTQELIAHTLGVRRESVTEVAGRLQAAGLIRYTRGHITVLDRPRLETQACECHRVVKREYERLLPPENTVGNAGSGNISQGRSRASGNGGDGVSSNCKEYLTPPKVSNMMCC